MKTKIVKPSELKPNGSLLPQDYMGGVKTRVTELPTDKARYRVQWQFDTGPIYTRDNWGMGYSREMAHTQASFIQDHPAVAARGLTDRDKASAQPGQL